MKYNVFDKDNKYLGVIHGGDPKEALEEAKAFGMKDADHVEEREDIIYREKKNEIPTDLH